MKLEVNSADAMKALGAQIGALTRGGEVIELVGDGAMITTWQDAVLAAEQLLDTFHTLESSYAQPFCEC